MEIQRDLGRNTLSLSQETFIQDPLETFQIRDCTTEPTPQGTSVVLEKENNVTPEQIAAQPIDYRGLVALLMHLVRCTRPDIVRAVRELSNNLSCYNKTH